MGNTNSTIPCVVAGVTLPLREYTTKHNNAAWALLGKKADGTRFNPGSMGINLEGIFSELPTGDVEILGVTVPITVEVTKPGSRFDPETGKTRTWAGGQRRAVAEVEVIVPNYGKKVFEFRVTEGKGAKDGVFNTAIGIHGVSDGTNSKAPRHHLDDL